MIALFYALIIGPTHWPITELHTWVCLAEMTTELVSMIAVVVIGTLRGVK